MAVDTREKRMNAARVARPWMRARHAVGATDEQSRIATGHGYGGNALSPGLVAFTTAPFTAIGWVDPFTSEGYIDPTSSIGYVDPFTSAGES